MLMKDAKIDPGNRDFIFTKTLKSRLKIIKEASAFAIFSVELEGAWRNALNYAVF